VAAQVRPARAGQAIEWRIVWIISGESFTR
jgi:hypothetical protein